MNILFVCTGNTCRSPLAEALAARMAMDRLWTDVSVGSAGTSTWEGAPASDAAILVGMEHGLDLSAHRARQLGAELVSRSDLILAMAPHHLDRVEALGGVGKSHLLTEFASRGGARNAIADPFGGDLDAYRATLRELDGEIQNLFALLAQRRER